MKYSLYLCFKTQLLFERFLPIRGICIRFVTKKALSVSECGSLFFALMLFHVQSLSMSVINSFISSAVVAQLVQNLTI